eukprot:1393074-Amorphochlora_amoeboformis.AAC.1
MPSVYMTMQVCPRPKDDHEHIYKPNHICHRHINMDTCISTWTRAYQHGHVHINMDTTIRRAYEHDATIRCAPKHGHCSVQSVYM